MRVSILAPLLGVVLGGAYCGAESEQTQAEKLFRQMEAELAKAKTLECHFETTVHACPGGIARGSLHFGDGNKSRLEFSNLGEGQNSDPVITITSGKQLATFMIGEPVQAQDAPKWLSEAHKTGFGRVGVTMALLVPLADKGKEFKADDAFSVTDVKLGEKTRLGLREAHRIEYTLVTNGLENRRGKTRFAVCLWVDMKTNLPLKRVVVPKEKDLYFILTETYKELTLGGKIDPKKFELPKE